jgi:hypothetical protein
MTATLVQLQQQPSLRQGRALLTLVIGTRLTVGRALLTLVTRTRLMVGGKPCMAASELARAHITASVRRCSSAPGRCRSPCMMDRQAASDASPTGSAQRLRRCRRTGLPEAAAAKTAARPGSGSETSATTARLRASSQHRSGAPPAARAALVHPELSASSVRTRCFKATGRTDHADCRCGECSCQGRAASLVGEACLVLVSPMPATAVPGSLSFPSATAA